LIKKIIQISGHGDAPDTKIFWMSKSPEERVEAVETIRGHYYLMLGYTEPPRIKKIIRIT
jgi:hypothetical protein